MQLAKSFEQAACILVLLATQRPDVPLTSAAIHARIGGSETYLRKIMHKLVLGQLVASTSGNNGGMQLARSAAAITIADVVVAIEGPVHTFPDRGYFDQVFNDVEPVADAGTQVVNDIFAQADQRWLAFLAQQKLATLIKELLAVPQIPVLDWNNQTEDKMQVLNRLLTRLRQTK
ncbi:Rrf2 family transcriptional regulator [Lactiplantibacillus mudanjiangensis]|uniref:Rrf2 family transcriptional regulator [Lactobacillus sp.] n=1 Tax=Lactiplantibacillus mudanjiangensis TaxID=1296538 RepID=A0A660E434_9LACO|nr:Rrf2 family transcriptional regulator [Lactiplantibacillus mudanjiangensis]VDG17714.1 Rrf2 family transcriptional regulator [Lactobacillus sp.] [Lactiplantibacillus mudanjiangensis]VDG25110.1 Rrf2 family transcriptional regulator [Lactobacillus sp.] [Lactiplantibacillus mudanjiangensis]VDG29481.1 Rrf2 family transcriptional regulator [Lactobacillus sp.] [Lactiplantibacillus mudanjiangensis]VDG32594.1 Rrf2 family transcriptional regulator [Lactobacillus sp.] [Lactiplantibacillus mudanjiangens